MGAYGVCAATTVGPTTADFIHAAIEIGPFLEAAKSSPLRFFFELMLASGARPGELRALRWKDIDLR